VVSRNGKAVAVVVACGGHRLASRDGKFFALIAGQVEVIGNIFFLLDGY
jgi:hypothetical protein